MSGPAYDPELDSLESYNEAMRAIVRAGMPVPEFLKSRKGENTMLANPQGWRANPNLVACFENCVAMFRGLAPKTRSAPKEEAVHIRERRKALGLTQRDLGEAAGYAVSGASSVICRIERGSYFAATSECRLRAEAALDRLETPPSSKEPTP